MGEPATLELERRTSAVRARLAGALERFGRLVYANSLGLEAMVLTDIICSGFPAIDMFSIDTGRLHEESYRLLDELKRRYGRSIRLVSPDAAALERLVERQGVNGFYGSVEARLACCQIRKVEPFRRAIAGFDAWITGVRHEQSAERAQVEAVEWDAAHGLYKVSPLIEWSEAHVWEYIRAHRLPYNRLHDRQYPSIGCAPCTRAVQPGEGPRSGRWWWEQTESRECGLQPRIPAPKLTLQARHA
jgi:phosphoadenosine phosphosulfate reductase